MQPDISIFQAIVFLYKTRGQRVRYLSSIPPFLARSLRVQLQQNSSSSTLHEAMVLRISSQNRVMGLRSLPSTSSPIPSSLSSEIRRYRPESGEH